MPLIAALIVKEFQTWLRGRLTFAVFGALVLTTSLMVFFLGLLILAPDANAAPALFSTTSTSSPNLLVAHRALFLFGAVGQCVLLTAGVVAPAVAASAFAGERERGTLDLLLLQGPGPARIVLAKVLAAFAFSLMVLMVAIPLFAPAWSFGGVQPEPIWAQASVLLTATLLFCALGVFFGALVPSALPAALFAQAAALFLLFGTLGLHLAFATLGGNNSLKPLLWLNPFVALLSGAGPVTDAFARQVPGAIRGALSLPATTWVPGLLLPAWMIANVAWAILSIGLIFAASIVIDPCHSLKPRYRS
jgi:ABC-type transport system involved in multi-copper enzyme maturation permease subunit